MDVKPPIAQSPNSALTAYQRPPQVLRRINIPPLPVSLEDIIDSIEIETSKPLSADIHTETRKSSPASKQVVNYKYLSTDLINEKGTFVDLWI
jgi:hypothetical protein